MKKKTKTQLAREINKLRDQLDQIEEAEAKALNKKLLGQCFKYHNSYGSGPRWWLYVQIVSVDGRWVKVVSFQDDGQGRIEFENEKPHMAAQFDRGGYLPISFDEYRAAYVAIVERLPKPKVNL